MQIGDVYGTTREKIENGKHFPMFGISFGNRFFVERNGFEGKRKTLTVTPNVHEYIQWAIQYSRSRVAILVPDEIEEYNIQVRDRKNPKAAKRLARERGDEIQSSIEHFRDSLGENLVQSVDIRRWKDVAEDYEAYEINFSVIEEEFLKGGNFYLEVRNFVDSFLKNSPRNKIPESERDNLCYYFLKEAAVLIGGFEYRSDEGNMVVADLLLYPFIAGVQRLIIDIQNGKRYNHLIKRLELRSSLAAVALNSKKT